MVRTAVFVPIELEELMAELLVRFKRESTVEGLATIVVAEDELAETAWCVSLEPDRGELVGTMAATQLGAQADTLETDALAEVKLCRSVIETAGTEAAAVEVTLEVEAVESTEDVAPEDCWQSFQTWLSSFLKGSSRS